MGSRRIGYDWVKMHHWTVNFKLVHLMGRNGWISGARRFLGQWSYSVCCYNGRCMSLYIVPHQERKEKEKSLGCVQLFATLWTVAYQAPLSMGFSRQEYWSGLPFPSPRYLPDQRIKPRSPALQANTLLSEPPGKPSPRVEPNVLMDIE